MSAADGPGPLAGLRVVELSMYVAAPFAGLRLVQLGAEVIRVEPPGGAGDRTRWPLAPSGASLYWTGLNRGKRSVAVDLRTQAGQEVVSRLICSGGPSGGIVLGNTPRPSALGYEALSQRRPDVIDVRLVGTHDAGSAVDYTVQAGTGFQVLTGPADSSVPVNHKVPAWDLAAGLELVAGLLGAERRRLRTGAGGAVVVALEDVALGAAGALGHLAAADLGVGPTRPDGNYLYGSFGRDFATADGSRVMLVVPTARQWEALVDETGSGPALDELRSAHGAELSDEGERYRWRREISAVLEGWFARHGADDVVARLRARGVLCERYRSFGEVVAANVSGSQSNPLIAEAVQEGIGPHVATGGSIVVDGVRPRPLPAPAAGQDTRAVLDELGLTAREVDGLVAQGVITTE